MAKKINILVVVSDTTGGVGFFRSVQPHKKLEEMYPDKFHVVYESNPNFTDFDTLRMFDIVHIHKGVFTNDAQFVEAMKFFADNDIVTIMDIDDHWKLGEHHPQHLTMRMTKNDEVIKRNFRFFNYVTTTTELFAKQIRPFNSDVKIFPNAIDPTDSRFQVHKEPCDKLRIGMIMGSTHEYDMRIMNNPASILPREVLDKVVFVLCGYDLRGTIREYNPQTHEEKVRKMQPRESVWYRYEKMMTNDYKIISPEYRAFLEQFTPDAAYDKAYEEGYKRCWTKDMDHYYEHYNEVDVLLAPLECNEFNSVKSQLKVIECAFSNTAIVASNFGPYTLDLTNALERGGTINPNGNAILIDERKNPQNWAKAIKRLVKNPELVTMLQNNLHNSICERYDLRNVTEERARFYEEIVEKAKAKK